jgi:hypothetical protein
LPLGEPEQVGDVPRRPLADAVKRLAGQEQVLEQDQETGGRIDAAAAVLGGQIRAEELRESQAFEDAIEDREQSDAVGVEVMSGRIGAMADLGGGLGFIRRVHRCRSGRICGVADESCGPLDRRVTSGRRAAIPADIIVRSEGSSRGERL